jgi:hypothetical protein
MRTTTSDREQLLNIAVVHFLPNESRAKGNDHVEPMTTLPRNSAGAVPLVEGNIARGEEMRKAKAREDGPLKL